MFRHKTILPLLFIISFLSCTNQKKENIKGVWLLTDIIAEDSKSANFSAYMDNISDKFNGFSYLNLQADSTYTCRLGDAFTYGRWTYDVDNKDLTLTWIRSRYPAMIQYSIKELTLENLKLNFKNQTLTNDDNVYLANGFADFLLDRDIVAQFVRDHYEYDYPERNIYTLPNNQWRIKPQQPESKEQVKVRVKENLQYIILYLEDRMLRDEAAINMLSISSPIMLGGNGIALKTESNLPAEWKECFFNDDQSGIAYEMLRDGFRQNIVFKEGESNWVKLDVDLLKQLVTKL